MEKVPLHVGIIMDGNGRWATKRNLPRTKGHQEGLKRAKEIALSAKALGVRHLSYYVFSTENWKRTKREVEFLMGLLRKHIRDEASFYESHKIKVLYSGNREGLSSGVSDDILEVVSDTEKYNDLSVTLHINYGGRDEIVRACNRYIRSGSSELLTEETFNNYLDHPELPPLDLLIRTGGEQRISNFMLWQAAYAELYFSDKFWPEWDESDLREAIDTFNRRERRLGGIYE